MSPEDFRSSYVSAILESCVVLLLPFFVLCPNVGAECTPPPHNSSFLRMLKRDVAGNSFVNFTLIVMFAVKMFPIIVVLGRCGIII